jgi:hypothetical protein
MKLRKTTPVLFVEAIEPQLAFWRDRMGYELLVEVPHGAHLGFVIMARDGVEMMLQTLASGRADLPEAMPHLQAGSVLFFHEVADLKAVLPLVAGLKVVAGPRESPYGMHEIFVVDTAGMVHGYAQRL